MVSLTFITAVAPHHNDVLQRAIASVQAQTTACEHIVVYDTHKIGPAWARNKGLEQVATEFVSFLDADDELDPRFTEKCLHAFDGKRYVYVDHWNDDIHVRAPCLPFANRTWHVITTLIPTAWVREIGGFDDSLPGIEDTGFFMALMAAGHCGKRLPEPLFHYHAGGERSKAFVNHPAQDTIMRRFTELYGAKVMACGDCGGSPNIDQPPIGDPLPGDVLALAMWAGNRQERGRATGRLYPRAGNGKQMYVASADISVSPHLWQRIVDTPLPLAYPNIPAQAKVTYLEPAPPDAFPQKLMDTPLDGAVEVGAAFNDFQRAHWPQLPPTPPVNIEPVAVTPDVAKAVGLYRQARGA